MDKQLIKKAEQAASDPRMTRAMRAMMGMANNQLQVTSFIAGMVWTVRSSMSGSPKEYMVVHNAEGWACECPDFQRRGQDCKHILAVHLLTESRI